MHDPTTPLPDPGSCPCSAALAAVRADLDALRTELAEEVRTRSVVLIDGEGVERVRVAAAADATEVVVSDPDGHERIRLTASRSEGHLRIRSRTVAGDTGDPTQVDVFALDPDPEDAADHPYVGLELIDRGTSTAGLSLYEGHPPHLWTHDPDE